MMRLPKLSWLLVLALAAPATFASDAFVRSNVNLRAGPYGDYPRLATLPLGATLNVLGCLEGFSWCDVEWQGQRGWVSADYLDYQHDRRRVRLPEYGARSGFNIVAFDLNNYWDSNYRSRSWYGQREDFSRRHPDHAKGRPMQHQANSSPHQDNRGNNDRKDDRPENNNGNNSNKGHDPKGENRGDSRDRPH